MMFVYLLIKNLTGTEFFLIKLKSGHSHFFDLLPLFQSVLEIYAANVRAKSAVFTSILEKQP